MRVTGFRPSASALDDRSYLDYVLALRKFATSTLNDVAGMAADEVLSREGPVGDEATLRGLLDPLPVMGYRNRVLRTQQEMMWQRIRETLEPRREELLAELTRAETEGPGSVHYDPDFVYPDYFTSAEIHLQPASYHGDDLAGFIYHYGTDIFYVGRNRLDTVKQAAVNRVPLPDQGPVTSVLDLACSIGQSTTALKRRLPDARVVGIDIAAPMVRYAHLRASRLDIDVDFRQESAADLSFEDASFDLVYCNILFHEIPRSTAESVVAEAHRILRQGGLFVIQDFANRSPNGPMGMPDYHRSVDTNFNGEPYASDFVYSDFLGLLKSHFADVNPDHTPDPTGIRQLRVCTK